MHWLLTCDRTAADSLGGMTVTLLETGKQLVASGDQVTWLTGRMNDSIPTEGMIDGIEVLSHPAINIGFRNLLSLRGFFRSGLNRLLREQDIDAAIIHQPIAGEAIGLRLQNAGVPACYFFHSPWAREFRIQAGVGSPGKRLRYFLRQMIERRALKSFETVIVFSQTMTDLLHSDHPGIPLPVRVTPGINLERFHPPLDPIASRNRLKWPESGTILLTVRRLVPRMGVDMLLHAFRNISEQHPDVSLLIGGSGPLREELETLAQRLGVVDRVRFLGYLTDRDLVEAYGAADLFIMPTRELEGLGLVTLEAMACGTGVVATPVGGNIELMTPFDPDLLAPEATSEGLTATLHSVLSKGPEYLQELGVRSRDHVESRYGWERTTADIRAVFDQ